MTAVAHASGVRPKLMVISSAYSLAALRRRGLEKTVTFRDLNGFFEHVWTVNPTVGADQTEATVAFGPRTSDELNDAHTFIQSFVGRYRWLQRVPPLNFAVALAGLVAALVRLARHERISVVCGDPYLSGLIGWVVSRMSGARFEVRLLGNHDAVYEQTGDMAQKRLFRTRRIEKLVEHFVLSRADLVSVGSADNLTFALRNGATREKTRFWGNSAMINPIHFAEPGSRSGTLPSTPSADPFLVVCVARLERVKHVEDVVLLTAELVAAGVDASAVLAGEGSLREELVDLCAEHHVTDRVSLPGSLSQQDIAQLLARASVVFCPMSGLALVEALLSSTPVVAYDVEWHGEIIEHETSGLLVPYRDIAAASKAVQRLQADPTWAGEVGRRGRERVLKDFDPEGFVQRERDNYADLFGLGPSADVRR